MINPEWFESVRSSSLFAATGMTAVHFLWEGAVIAVAGALLLELLGGRSPRERYAVCLAAMLAMLGAPAVTFLALRAASAAGAAGTFPGVLPLPGAPGAASLGLRLDSFLPWIALFWLAGASTLQARLVVQWLAVQRLRRSARSDAPARWREAVDDLRRRMGIARVVRIAESALVAVPSVAGTLRPVILMPLGALATFTPAMLRGVLAHELAHIRRHDYAVNLLQNFLESALFFHPAVWWLSCRMREEREFCCDDLAVALCDDRAGYARALCELDRFRRENRRQFVPAFNGGSVMDRIARIAGADRPSGRRALGAWLAPMIALLVVGTAWSAVRGGPGRVHVEAPDVTLPDIEELADGVYVLQEQLGDLDDLDISLDIDLDDLADLRDDLRDEIDGFTVGMLPHMPDIAPQPPLVRAPRIYPFPRFNHRLAHRSRAHLEYFEQARAELHAESMGVIEDLIDGDISEKEAAERLEALVKTYRESEAKAEELRKKSVVERAEAQVEAEREAKERAQEMLEQQRAARERARQID